MCRQCMCGLETSDHPATVLCWKRGPGGPFWETSDQSCKGVPREDNYVAVSARCHAWHERAGIMCLPQSASLKENRSVLHLNQPPCVK